MISGVGLTKIKLIDTLRFVHEGMKSVQLGAHRLSVTELLHAAELVKDMIDRGFPLYEALQHSCFDVYVRSQKNVHLKQVF